MNRLAMAAAALMISSTAFAWSVPLSSAEYSAGPHPAGQDIDCTYTNDDGQVFNGTIQGPSGSLVCAGDVVITREDTVAVAAPQELSGYDLCDALWENSVTFDIDGCYDLASVEADLPEASQSERGLSFGTDVSKYNLDED
jgi:hypothetical protein